MLSYSFYALTVFVAWVYVFLICFIMKQWGRTKLITIDPNSQVVISVIVVARNESKNIGACLRSILDNNYPKHLYKVILVDDHSEDETKQIASQFENVRILNLGDYIKQSNTNNFKKEAITYAIDHSQGELIVCTDADCIVPKNWLQFHASSYAAGNKFTAAPISFSPQDSFLNKFEALDILGMMGVTIAGIQSQKWYMANGANMSFVKAVYKKLNPYRQNQNASGDDIKLVQAMAKENLRIHFVKNKEALVRSKSNDSLKDFVQQRIRWGSKNKNSNSKIYSLVMLIPFILSLMIIIFPFFLFIDPIYASITITIILFLKFGVDYFYLKTLTDFYGDSKILKAFIPSAIMHIVYISIVGLLSLFISKYKWKGRKVS